MLARPDPFDPNTFEPCEHEFRIYGDDRASMWAVVDEADYIFFCRWRWCPTKPGTHHRRKLYLRRSSHSGRFHFYLHVEIMKRVEPSPSPAHTLVDHLDGDGLNCRRSNLRWATPRENNLNRFGIATRQSRLA